MNKTLPKAITLRTNIFLRNSSEKKNKDNYRKQRNIFVQFLRKSKRDYCGSPNECNICDSKTFCKAVKPFVSNEVISNEKITLIE